MTKENSKQEPEAQESEIVIGITEDEALVIIEQLSHRPYREVYQMITGLSVRLNTAKQQAEKQSKIIIGE